MMKISFDFDSTLSEARTQRLAEKLIQAGHDVWITSSRVSHNDADWNRDLYSVAKELGIPRGKIQLTGGSDKWNYLIGFDLHFDDDQVEIELIEENLPECVGILIFDP